MEFLMPEILQHIKIGVFQSLAVLKAAVIYSSALHLHDSAYVLFRATTLH